jgi:hypothetical protein
MPWTPFSNEPEAKLAGAALSSHLHRVLGGHTGPVRSGPQDQGGPADEVMRPTMVGT